MMQNVAVEVDLESLENKRHVMGSIYFVIDYHRYFPEAGWSDFVVIVLSWWIQSCKALMISKIGVTHEFDFMDGSPIVLAKKIDTHKAELLFCLDDSNRKFMDSTYLLPLLNDFYQFDLFSSCVLS